MNNVHHRQFGFTLIELLIAAVLLASISVITTGAISSSTKAGEFNEYRSESLRAIDRFWVLLENDLRNIVAYQKQTQFDVPLPPMRVDQTDLYQLMLLRAGQANPLLLPRSEVLRVAYRFDDNTLWRDSWIDAYNPQEETAREQKLLDNIEELSITVLPRSPEGRSIEEGPWLEQWPIDGRPTVTLPLAVEVKLNHKAMGEITRLVTLVPGA